MRRANGPRGARALALPAIGTVLLFAATQLACSPRQQNPPPAASPSPLGVGFRDADNSAILDLRHHADVGETLVPASLTAVWGVLPDVFRHLGIELTFFDASAGALGNGGYRARRIEGQRMSRWLDCGRDVIQANADAYDVTLSVMVQVLAAPDQGTTVRTTVDAYARGRGISGGSVHCVSWGTLERRIPELVLERLGG